MVHEGGEPTTIPLRDKFFSKHQNCIFRVDGESCSRKKLKNFLKIQPMPEGHIGRHPYPWYPDRRSRLGSQAVGVGLDAVGDFVS